MFYKVCLGLAIGIVTLSLVGSFANASSLTIRQQNFVDDRAQGRIRSTYIVPIPYGYRGGSGGYSSGSGGSGGSGSGRSSYDGYRGGGPGSGK